MSKPDVLQKALYASMLARYQADTSYRPKSLNVNPLQEWLNALY